jgi:bifunctional DNase/RNase
MKQIGASLALGGVLTFVIMVTASMVGGSAPREQRVEKGSEATQVQIRDIEVRLSDHGFVVLLRAESKVIPIFVDPTVAGSIQGALTGEKTKRPLSHDLMRSILEGFGGKVTQTSITLKDGIYYGALTVAIKDTTKIFDSRSSDAIALAIHFKAPILVGRDLLDSVGKQTPAPKTQTL